MTQTVPKPMGPAESAKIPRCRALPNSRPRKSISKASIPSTITSAPSRNASALCCPDSLAKDADLCLGIDITNNLKHDVRFQPSLRGAGCAVLPVGVADFEHIGIGNCESPDPQSGERDEVHPADAS